MHAKYLMSKCVISTHIKQEFLKQVQESVIKGFRFFLSHDRKQAENDVFQHGIQYYQKNTPQEQGAFLI